MKHKATQEKKKQWQVEPSDQGKRLVLFLHERMGESYSARHIKRLLEQNRCQVNGNVERFASRSLRAGDKIIFLVDDLPRTAQAQAQAPASALPSAPVSGEDVVGEDLGESVVEPAKITRKVKKAVETKAILSWPVVHQDKDLLVVHKPSGIAVDTDEGKAALLKAFGEVFLVHRLDKETSGLLLLARTKEMGKSLEALFRTHEIEKGYLALVDGLIHEEVGEVRNHIGKVHSYEGQSLRGAVSPEQGRLAHTLWRVLGRGQGATLVACEPRTGRTHQIRVHMKSIGHPILGDYQYARSFHCPLRPTRCLLHAAELTFTHPTTGERKRYRAKMPDDFLHALSEVKIPFARKAQLELRRAIRSSRANRSNSEQIE